jgi:exopolysaccharide biosynthesis protein
MTSNFNDSDLYQYPPFNQHRADPIWNRDSDYLVPVVSSVGNGPKGDKGDPLVFDDLTDEQMQKVLQDANYVGNKAEEATYITGSGTTSVIEIPIADFDQFDMLFVDIEGLDLHEGADYDIVGNNIILNTPITHSGTKVHFKALSYTLIDGDKTIQNVMGHHDYDTVATMKLDTDIELGAICHTLGFNAKGDKGAAWYKVTDDAIATETDVISLDNGYYAIMYKDDESVNPEMLGVFDYTLTEWAGTTRSYSKRTVVYWGSSAYTARQDVPTGIQITNMEYWVPWKNIAALSGVVDDLFDELGQETENREAADVNLQTQVNNCKDAINNYGVTYEYVEEENYICGLITFPKEYYGMKIALNGSSNNQSDTLRNYAKREKPLFCFNCTNSNSFIYNGVLSGGNYVPDADNGAFYIFNDDNTDLVRAERTDGVKSWQTIFNQGIKNCVGGWQNLIENGTLIEIADYETFTTRNPYPVIGWDDDNYYFMQVIGRKNTKPGILFTEIQAIAQRKQWQNCGVLDGGDSQRAFFGEPLTAFSTRYNRTHEDRTAYVNITMYEREV